MPKNEVKFEVPFSTDADSEARLAEIDAIKQFLRQHLDSDSPVWSRIMPKKYIDGAIAVASRSAVNVDAQAIFDEDFDPFDNPGLAVTQFFNVSYDLDFGVASSHEPYVSSVAAGGEFDFVEYDFTAHSGSIKLLAANKREFFFYLLILATAKAVDDRLALSRVDAVC
ncbi:hypothetical protein [Limosilactobacillus antri]|uniref:hypothetical protein n=1 Tax=Limosilactobacillus antri TaxID=227943 RepID=UPI001F5970B2|nr:hypothetical protein [Limosilactobacillus antri]